MADKTAMSRRGVAWWGHNATPGTCACCGTVGRVHMGYNGGQSTAVQFCGTCTVSGHMGCEASAPRLVSDARERLARHLYVYEWAAHPVLRPEVARRWDLGEVPDDKRTEYVRRADALLAVITGTSA